MKNDSNSETNVVKSVALKAGVWYVVSSVMVKMISVITTPIFTRTLSTTEYGTVATFTAWYALFIVICTLCLTNTIGRAKIDFPNKLNEYIGSIQSLSVIFTILLGLIVILFLPSVATFLELSESATMLLLAYLISSPAIIFYQNSCRYQYKYKQNIIIAWYTAITTVALSLLLLFTIDGDKAILRIMGLVLPTVTLSLFLWLRSLKQGYINAKIGYWKYGLMISLPLISHAISMNILSQSNRVIISKLCDTTATAYYSLVASYALLITVVTEAVNQGWQPWFHDNYAKGNNRLIRKNTKLIVLFECYIGLACMAFAPEAIYILGGEQYLGAIDCIVPMVLGVVCQSIYIHYINIELHLKKTIHASWGTLFAAIVNILLNLLLIPKYGYVASAYATFISYCLLLIIHFLITRLLLKVKLYNDFFMFIAIGGMLLLSLLFSFTYDVILYRCLLMAAVLTSFLVIFRSYAKNTVYQFFKKKKDA